jgi:hypothetical protein
MTSSLPDIYVHATPTAILLQGASWAAIEFLGSLGTLMDGTTAVVPLESAEQAFAAVDAFGLQTMCLG